MRPRTRADTLLPCHVAPALANGAVYPDGTVCISIPPALANGADYPDGTVCISILHTPGDDPTMYEQASERWSPVQSVEKVILSVISMLAGTPPTRCACT